MQDFLDRITDDFKGSGETSFVRKYIGIANAKPIFKTLLELRDKTKVHIEITDLIVPEVGDDLGAAKRPSSWVYDNLRRIAITVAGNLSPLLLLVNNSSGSTHNDTESPINPPMAAENLDCSSYLCSALILMYNWVSYEVPQKG